MALSLAEIILPFLDADDADGFLFTGPIDRNSADSAVRVIETQEKKRKNVHFFLTTGGGDPNAAYRIGRALRRNYPGTVRFFFGGYCKSAGTLLALCADELVFSSFGELGPLDVQIGKPNELMGADSGLDLRQALKQLAETAFESFQQQLIDIVSGSGGAISTTVAAEIATTLTIGIMSPIAGQVDPLRLGYSWRANQIGVHYGNLLASGNVEPGTVHKLVNGYPAQEVVIDELEAKQLFKEVRHSNEVEAEIFRELAFLLRIPRDRAFVTSFRTDFKIEAETEAIEVATESIHNGVSDENHEVGADSGEATVREPARENDPDFRSANEGEKAGRAERGRTQAACS